MTDRAPHFQSLAVAILGIGTAVLGFGLFGADFSEKPEILWPQFIVVGIALFYYLMLIRSVRKILTAAEVTGKDVERSLYWMTQTMGALVMLFVGGVAGFFLSD